MPGGNGVQALNRMTPRTSGLPTAWLKSQLGSKGHISPFGAWSSLAYKMGVSLLPKSHCTDPAKVIEDPYELTAL